jgi:hypothetical protein
LERSPSFLAGSKRLTRNPTKGRSIKNSKNDIINS